jgi:hypothetical protein
MATGCGLDDREVGVRVPLGSTIFSSPYRPDRFFGPPTYYPMGTAVLSPGSKRTGRDADHLPPTSVMAFMV